MKKTIDKVFTQSGSKIINIKFTDGTECMAFNDTKFGAPLEEGDEQECVIVTKTSKNSGKQYEQLTQWGPAVEPAPRQGGGGGRGGWQPPSPQQMALDGSKSVLSTLAHVAGHLVQTGAFVTGEGAKAKIDFDTLEAWAKSFGTVLTGIEVKAVEAIKVVVS